MTSTKKSLPNLPHAQHKSVVTRFPPEASGYLHLGHIKALLLNYLYAKKYDGKIILRFDDTNPDKESPLYEQAILEDIQMLGLNCDEITYASDYFDKIEELAIYLIKQSLAYVDFRTKNEIADGRAKLLPSPYIDSTVEDNLIFFDHMRAGIISDCCLRAKIDYCSKNGCLRDPVIYRAKHGSHPRQSTKYCIYPTYDFACPILDAQQGVTHAMRSVEYSDRNILYEWFLTHLNLKNGPYPIVSEYGKLNFTHTVLSKRKLGQLIDAHLVDGWDDPRLPTLRGIMRKGICIDPLVEYIKLQVNSKAIVQLSWDKLWNFNRMHLDRTVNRIYGLDINPITIKLIGDAIPDKVQLANHPKNPSFGTRTMAITSELQVDAEDFSTAKIGDRYTLVGLGNATIVCMDPLTLKYNAADKDFKSTIKITWLPNNQDIIKVTAKTFAHLLSKPKMDPGDNIVDIFNRNSLISKMMLVENSVKNYQRGSVVQIMRKGYYYIEKMEGDIILHTVP